MYIYLCAKSSVTLAPARILVEAWGGRPATTITSPSHILRIFSSEPTRNLVFPAEKDA